MKVKMTLGRDTKGTHVYKNEDDGTPIRSLYIARSAITGEPPKTITVEIKEIK